MVEEFVFLEILIISFSLGFVFLRVGLKVVADLEINTMLLNNEKNINRLWRICSVF